MAITNNGTKVSVPSGKLPSGYTKPTVVEFTDYEQKYTAHSFTVAKSTVENADKATTLAALVAAVNVLVTAVITFDFVAANTVTAYADLKDYRTNMVIGEDLLTNTVTNYICTVDIYAKTAV